MRPFMNPAIIGVLKHHFLVGRKALHHLFPAEFKQNLPTARGGKGPEVPPVLLTLATTFVCSDWPDNIHDAVAHICHRYMQPFRHSWTPAGNGSTTVLVRYTGDTLPIWREYKKETPLVITCCWIGYIPNARKFSSFLDGYQLTSFTSRIPNPTHDPAEAATETDVMNIPLHWWFWVAYE